MVLAPLQNAGKDLFWIGSTYAWDFDHADPTPAFRETTERVLREWLKIPFRVTDHRAALRPATLERRPFVGLHPNHKQVGILNGMGTKGCSLAPFFAKQMSELLLHGNAITADADVNRFQKILSR
jgi:glycine/D-amino acid oxidase-like deaminating enzyme